jgi:hypothetical protein
MNFSVVDHNRLQMGILSHNPSMARRPLLWPKYGHVPSVTVGAVAGAAASSAMVVLPALPVSAERGHRDERGLDRLPAGPLTMNMVPMVVESTGMPRSWRRNASFSGGGSDTSWLCSS